MAYAQEMLNFWKQNSHVMKYFRTDEDENAKLPKNFIQGFLEVCVSGSREGQTHYQDHLLANLYLKFL